MKLSEEELKTKIYIHNEIFDELKLLHDKGSSHVAFTYSYYYLICWLYRYTKYREWNVDVKMIKGMLGYSGGNQDINYIIKKNGTLDQIGLTHSSSDFPTSWEIIDGDLNFNMLSEFDYGDRDYIGKGKNYKVKVPTKALWRTDESRQFKICDGTFYEVDNTHCVPVAVFEFCMSKKDIGCIGFYLWSYLKMKCQMFKGYDVSLCKLSNETGVAKRTVIKYLNVMREYKMVKVTYNQEYFSLTLGDDERKANTYTVNEYGGFSDVKVDVVKLNDKSKMDTITDDELSQLFM